MEIVNANVSLDDIINSGDLATTQLVIILGSKNDWENFGKLKKMRDILDEIGISYIVVVISAHRNSNELESFCVRAAQANPRMVFIGIAGGAAALPGAIVAITEGKHPVIGVALPSGISPDGRGAEFAIMRTPGDIPVDYAGVGESGLQKAALIAARILGQGHMKTCGAYYEYLEKHKQDKPTKVLYLSDSSKS